MSVEVHGLIGLLLLVAAIWSIVNVVGSGVSTGGKALWILLILLFPLIGFLIWLFAGPRSAPRQR